MTTIVAIQGQGWAVLGAERRASDEDGFTSVMHCPKIFKNGPALIAGAGSVRGLNIIEHGWSAPSFGTTKTVEQYLTRKFIPSLRKAFIEAGYDMKSDKDVAEQDNDLIVAIRGRLFSIASDYSWDSCSKGLYKAGSGGKYAMGALAVLDAHKAKTPVQAENLIRKAITAAISYDCFSAGPIDTFIQEA